MYFKPLLNLLTQILLWIFVATSMVVEPIQRGRVFGDMLNLPSDYEIFL